MRAPPEQTLGGDVVAAAVAALRRGELVAFPTETVYGLGADADNPAALDALYRLKGRPPDHPVIVHLAHAALLGRWSRTLPVRVERLAAHFWPGPLTLILERATRVLDQVCGGQPTLGIRVPAHPVAQRLLQEFGGGVAAPSANRFGHISPTRAEHVRSEFAEGVAVVLDGGASEVGIESTILDCSGERLRLLRPGIISAARIESVVGEVVLSDEGTDRPRVSGSLPRHYAPAVPALLLDPVRLAQEVRRREPDGGQLGVIGFDAPLSGPQLYYRQMPHQPEAYARLLYATLRELEMCCERILVARPPDDDAWSAVMDRLRRACSGV